MKIVILNTGCANLSSVFWSLKRIFNGDLCISNAFKDIDDSDKLIIPGVGTALKAMNTIKEKKILKVLKEYSNPVLGICLGMQLICSYSEENLGVDTLGVIEYPVLKFKKKKDIPYPHMGWNVVSFLKDSVLFKNIPINSRFYFVHSYFLKKNIYTIATSNYGQEFSSVIQKRNFFGVQFHPEKSSLVGLQLLKNFLEI